MASKIVGGTSETFYLLRRHRDGWYQDGTGGLFHDAGDTNARPSKEDLADEYDPEINGYVKVLVQVSVVEA